MNIVILCYTKVSQPMVECMLAGSGLTMIKRIKNLVMFGFPVAEDVKCGKVNLARVMRYDKKGMIILAPMVAQQYSINITIFLFLLWKEKL